MATRAEDIVGCWESLDQERSEQQGRLPWYNRSWVVAVGFFSATAIFYFQFVYVLKAAARHLLSHL